MWTSCNNNSTERESAVAPVGAAERPRAAGESGPTLSGVLAGAGEGALTRVVNETGRCTVVGQDGEYWMNPVAGDEAVVRWGEAGAVLSGPVVGEADGRCVVAWLGSDAVQVFEGVSARASLTGLSRFEGVGGSGRRWYRDLVMQGHVVIVIDDSGVTIGGDDDGDSTRPDGSGVRRVYGVSPRDPIVDRIVGAGAGRGLVTGWPLGASASTWPLWYVTGGSGRWLAVSIGASR